MLYDHCHDDNSKLSMHFAKPAAFVRVSSVDSSIFDKSLTDYLVHCQQDIEGDGPQSSAGIRNPT